jgi:Flp pilus assembly pilin Flp
MSTGKSSSARAAFPAAHFHPVEESEKCGSGVAPSFVSEVKRLWLEERGDDMVEYGLLLVFVALAVASAVGLLTTAVKYAYGLFGGPDKGSIGNR